MPSKHNILFNFIYAFSFLLIAYSSHAQQLKLGNNPTQIEKSAVLQLDSKNQGLLLTKLSDTTAINLLSPPDGMLIYFTDSTEKTIPNINDGVYVRHNGFWYRQRKGFKVIRSNTLGGAVDFYYDPDTITLHLPNASSVISGLLDSSYSQSFGGDKLFQDSLIVNGNLYSHKLHLDSFKNSGSDTHFLTTDVNGKINLNNMAKGYWKVGGNIISNEEDSTLGKTYEKDMQFITGNMDRLHITSDGKVGINNPSPTDTLDVNGSFKLGRNGSSFERMGEGIVITPNNYSTGISLLGIILGAQGGVYIHSYNLSGVKKNASVYINPRSNINNVPIRLFLSILPITTITTGYMRTKIMWARAPSDDTIEIGLFFDIYGLVNLSGLLYLTSAEPISFDILYLNPQ